MQVRGLKRYSPGLAAHRARSHLMQVRGLKQDHVSAAHAGRRVAPHAGAWIETQDTLLSPGTERVLLRVGSDFVKLSKEIFYRELIGCL